MSSNSPEPSLQHQHHPLLSPPGRTVNPAFSHSPSGAPDVAKGYIPGDSPLGLEALGSELNSSRACPDLPPLQGEPTSIG